MGKEKDFTRVTFKVNSSGSWANLVTCDAGRYDEVKKACEVIAKAGHVKFKALDADGGELEYYGSDGRGSYGWHEPKRGRR
ncbi:MAG: hypothetical protein Q7U97_17605 [Rhodocyclaceae bacterium]|nr:hypothetical protein [Rhodocyclaceae bacterium]